VIFKVKNHEVNVNERDKNWFYISKVLTAAKPPCGIEMVKNNSHDSGAGAQYATRK